MVYLYTCAECQMGNHTNCYGIKTFDQERDYTFGGEMCTCCGGVDQEERASKEDEDWVNKFIEETGRYPMEKKQGDEIKEFKD